MQNTVSGEAMTPRAKGDGTFAIALPCSAHTRLPWIDPAADYGQFVRLAIEDAKYKDGGEICSSGEEITLGALVKQMAEGEAG